MQEREVLVENEDADEALLEAARTLNTDPENIELHPKDDGGFRAVLRNADAAVDIVVSADRLEVTVSDSAPPLGSGSAITPDGLAEQLTQARIVAEPDRDALAAVAEAVNKGQDVQGTVIARGTPAQQGTDGSAELVEATEQSVGATTEDGAVDFHERHTVHTVSPGDAVATVVLPTKGVAGVNVHGKAIPARDGKPAAMRAGVNVESNADGTALVAKVGGRVTCDGTTVTVTEAFELSGDVDLTSGNIRMPTGTVIIRGAVRAGFAVVAGKDIIVGEAIEDAEIEAGGSVQVRRGIAMPDEGWLKAGGDVTAGFMQNATIEAGGDIIVENDITTCNLQAGGRVVTTKGKGRIQGGTVRAGLGVEANQLGSALNVPTTIIVGEQWSESRGRAVKRLALTRALAAAEAAAKAAAEAAAAAEADEGADADAVPPPEDAGDAPEDTEAAREELAALDFHGDDRTSFMRWCAEARVTVHGTTFSGTDLEIAGCRLDVYDEIDDAVFCYDPQTDSILNESALPDEADEDDASG